MQNSDNLAHRIFYIFGERLALLIVLIVFATLFFLEVHPAFSQTEETYNGYSKNGLTYDFYLSSSYSESSDLKINIQATVTSSEVETIEHVEIKEVVEVTSSVGDDVWEELAVCESGGNWSINTGNGYYGGLQFSQGAWNSVGGTGLPHEHSREEQIEKGKVLQAMRGWGVWGLCAKKLGL